ncbi:MAG: spore cortex-lytic enzyme [Lachnospiraceae bacterium]|nr:spore cortex-lytic enzyme [Lachnospiraceae bacterium]
MRIKKFYALLLFFIAVSTYFISYKIYTVNNEVQLTASYGFGSVGSNVLIIQERLKNLAYYTGPVDGVFGGGTENAVKKFQMTHGLTPDGIVGTQTLMALGIEIEPPFTPGIYSEGDLYLLSSIIYGEGRGEPYKGQVAIGAVVLNRVNTAGFPDSIEGVIFQKGAFDAVVDGQINLTPNEVAINAATDALEGDDPTGGALYYWNPETATSEWIWTIPIRLTIGKHVFG